MVSDRDLDGWIKNAADCYISQETFDPAAISAFLQIQECPPELADIITEFLPIAFSEPVLEKLNIKRRDHYQRQLSNGEQIAIRWADDPIYLAVQRFVQWQIDHGGWPTYKCIAEVSSDFHVISEAMIAGKNVEQAALTTTPTTILSPDSPWLPIKT